MNDITWGMFRKKPVDVYARRLVDDMEIAKQLADWCNGVVLVTEDSQRVYIEISTLEGTMRADVGDWILQGVKGEFYPCKPDIFEMSYEPTPDYVDPYKIDVTSIVDQDDGSAVMSLEMGAEMLKIMAQIGVMRVVTDAATQVLDRAEGSEQTAI